MIATTTRESGTPFAIVIALAGILLPAPTMAQTYRWTDEFGRVNYGDALPDSAHGVDTLAPVTCDTEACQADDRRRLEEARDRNREIQQWVDRRSEERLKQAEIDARRAQAEAEAAHRQRQVVVPVPVWGAVGHPWRRWPHHDRPVAVPLPSLPDMKPEPSPTLPFPGGAD